MLKTTRHKLMQNQPKFLLRIDDNQRFAGIYDRKRALNHLKVELDLYQKFTKPLTVNQLYRYFKKRFTLTAVSHVYEKDDLIWYEPSTTPIDYLAWFNEVRKTDGDLDQQQPLTLPTYDRDQTVRHRNSQRPTAHAGYHRQHNGYCKHKGHFAAYYRYREAVTDVDQTLPWRHRYRKTITAFIDQGWDSEYGSRRSYGWKTSTHRKHQYKTRG